MLPFCIVNSALCSFVFDVFIIKKPVTLASRFIGCIRIGGKIIIFSDVRSAKSSHVIHSESLSDVLKMSLGIVTDNIQVVASRGRGVIQRVSNFVNMQLLTTFRLNEDQRRKYNCSCEWRVLESIRKTKAKTRPSKNFYSSKLTNNSTELFSSVGTIRTQHTAGWLQCNSALHSRL